MSLTRDVPDIRTLFPDRLPDAPAVLSSKFAKMVSLLVGYDVQLRLEFASEVKGKVDDIIKEVRTSGGTMSVFRYRVSVGEDVQMGEAGGGVAVDDLKSRVDTNFEDVKWDKEKGVLILTPTKGQVYPTILGAVAQRFQDS
jgi:hypothetical protein